MRASLAVLALILSLVVTWFCPQQTNGQEADDLNLGKPVTQRWQAGIEIRAINGPCAGLTGTFPVPKDWPDQEVREVDAEISPAVRSHSYRDAGGVRQMVLSIPQLPLNETAKALVTFEVTTRSVQAPAQPEALVIPKNPPAECRLWLGPSPMIDSRHDAIRDRANKIIADRATAWEQVEALYNWVRDNITYQSGNLKGALETLRKGNGDKEDKTWVFVALCRSCKVPARTVWVPDGCHAEFYLQDADGKGTWYPCQVEGTREFGSLSLPRPILERGDNFKVPEEKNAQFFVKEFVQGKGRNVGRPDVLFVRKLLPAN